MYLSQSENKIIFKILDDLTHNLGPSEIRHRLGNHLLELFNADYFASYIWNESNKTFGARVHINMSEANLEKYESYYQFNDPITHILQKRTKATIVTDVMRHKRLQKTEFYNDFLQADGLTFGINYFAHCFGKNIGDLRIWRKSGKPDFNEKERSVLDLIGKGFTNALLRTLAAEDPIFSLSFRMLEHQLQLTHREVQIADLIVSGQSDLEICDHLSIAKATLRTHISSIFRKLEIERRSQLVPFILRASALHSTVN